MTARFDLAFLYLSFFRFVFPSPYILSRFMLTNLDIKLLLRRLQVPPSNNANPRRDLQRKLPAMPQSHEFSRQPAALSLQLWRGLQSPKPSSPPSIRWLYFLRPPLQRWLSQRPLHRKLLLRQRDNQYHIPHKLLRVLSTAGRATAGLESAKLYIMFAGYDGGV